MERLEGSVSLKEMSAHVGLSPSYAGTLLKTELGHGFGGLLRRLRIERAQTLLRTSSLSVATIARRVGFHYANHFSRVFREISGQSPQDYRRFVSETKSSFPRSESQHQTKAPSA